MRIKIATRKSPLALWQAGEVREQLQRARGGMEISLLEITAQGDKSDAPLADIGGKGLFLKELQEAVLRGDADLAVHSMKDVPAEAVDGLMIKAVCAREDARDALVCNHFARIAQLPHGARIGTCSLRRQSQLRAKFPHLRFASVRGNLGTRLDKLDRGEFDAIVLAAAGLKRLRVAHRIAEIFAPEVCLPAPGQGALAVEYRADDASTHELLALLRDASTANCIAAERAVTARLGADCHAPLAAYAEPRGQSLHLRALVGSCDGAIIVRGEKVGGDDGDDDDTDAAAELGRALADELLARGAGKILQDARAN